MRANDSANSGAPVRPPLSEISAKVLCLQDVGPLCRGITLPVRAATEDVGAARCAWIDQT